MNNKKTKAATSVRSFVNALHKSSPVKIVKLLTDSGKEFLE